MNTSAEGPGSALGPPDLSYPQYAQHSMDGTDASRRYPYSNSNGNGQVQPARGHSPAPVKRSGSVSDDGNRSRNAKAQRRHREKRKAQLRLLEHKVVELEAQCESLTHKLNQCVSEGRGPLPSMQEFEALQAENAYLRQENAELRRNFGGRPPYPSMPPPGVGLEESKSSEGRFQGEYPHSGSPRGYERVNADYNHESGSNPSSSSGFHVDPMTRQHRSRLSLSSGLNSSPYVPSTPAFPDPRHHIDGRYSSGSGGSTQGQSQPGSGHGNGPGTGNGNGNGNGSYDHPGYHGPPPHVIPRNGVMYPSGEYNRENESWNNGPPPFTPQNPYGVYPDSQGQSQYSGTPHHPAHEFPDPGQGQGQTTSHGYSEATTASHSNEDF